jgi:hypothetical protein
LTFKAYNVLCDLLASSPRRAIIPGVERDTLPRGAKRRTVFTAGLCLLAVTLAWASTATAVAPRALASRTFSLNETGHLHLTSHHGFTLNEQGSASGTISGTIYLHLHVVSTNRVTAEVNIYPRGGSLTGYATASYHPSGGVASFNGTMSISRGSGRYSHAHGSGLSFTGTIQRANDAVTVHVNGRMSA